MEMSQTKERILKDAISILLLTLILFIEGCFSFLEFKFSFEKIKNPGFWALLGLNLVLLVLVKSLALNIFKTVARNRNKKLEEEKTKNERLMKCKEPDFNTFIVGTKNRQIKIEKWKLKVNKKLVRLEKFSRLKSRLLYNSTDPDKEFLKKRNRYCIKHDKYDMYLTDGYIDKHINTLPIRRYARLDPAVFDIPVNEALLKNANKIASKNLAANTVALLFSSISLFVTRTFLSLFMWDLNNEPMIAVIASLCMDLLFILWQFSSGIMDAYKIISSEELVPYINRNRILEEYYYWKHPNEVDKVTKFLELFKKEKPEA